nr:hypothetical protein [Selenomonas sp.]
MFDCPANALEMRAYIVIPEAQDAEAVLLQIMRASFIVQVRIFFSMLLTIKLDDETRSIADEIDDIWADGLLPLEFSWTRPQIVIP